VTIEHEMACQLESCKPWEDYLDKISIKLFRKALNKGDSELARSVVDAGSKDTATPWC